MAAAASCGATAAGERVAIKVLHPGVIRQVALDVYLMRTAAKLVEDWLPVRGLRWLALSDSADEFAAFMASQLDLRREATNLARFRANFGSERGGAQDGARHTGARHGAPTPPHLPASQRRRRPPREDGDARRSGHRHGRRPGRPAGGPAAPTGGGGGVDSGGRDSGGGGGGGGDTMA